MDIPVSTIYRKLDRLNKLGLGEPCIYVPIAAGDDTINILKRPILVLKKEHCVYIPHRCETDCFSCPYYPIHLNGLLKLGAVEGIYATPQGWADAFVERVKRRFSKGFKIE